MTCLFDPNRSPARPTAPKAANVARAAIVAMAAFSLLLSAPTVVEAQGRTRARVQELNRDAMSAYHDLDIDRAQEFLHEARELCERNEITGTLLAQVFVNLGTVAVGGLSDEEAGRRFFVQALQQDSDIALDPELSTPDIESVFALAQRQAASGNTGGAPEPTGDPLPHQPVAEQLVRTPMPVYIVAPTDRGVGRMLIYYRTEGMRRFERGEMERVGQGFGFEVPCGRVLAPSVRYYIVAYDEAGEALGFAGSQRDPYEVAVVDERTLAAPALPGREPSAQCTEEEACVGDECEAVPTGAAEGEDCSEEVACGEGLVCSEVGQCIPDETSASSSSGDGSGPRYWFQFGAGAGAFFATDGMVADRLPPDEDGMPNMPPGDWNSPEFASFIDPSTGQEGCNPGPNPIDLPDANMGGATRTYQVQSECHVRVTSSGLLPNGGLHVTVGAYFSDRVGIAVGARASIRAGQGTLARLHFNARLQFRVTDPTWEGLDVALFAGLGVGQIQLQPKQNARGSETVARPFIQTGLLSVQAGANMVYRIVNGFGIVLEPRGIVLLPVGAGNTLTFGIDLALGVQVGF